eukprot:scaffold5011_cov39-Isochrysis_galbana.AAC.1
MRSAKETKLMGAHRQLGRGMLREDHHGRGKGIPFEGGRDAALVCLLAHPAALAITPPTLTY